MTHPGGGSQDAWRARWLSEAEELLRNAAAFYSGRVEEDIGRRAGVATTTHGEADLPCDEVGVVWRLS